MRVRNPCLRIRRLFLGRYVGLPIPAPDDPKRDVMEAAKPICLSEIVQVFALLLAITSVDLSTFAP